MSQDQVRDLARSYTDAWCSRDPARVAEHYAPGATIAINGGTPTAITEVEAEAIEFHWTFIGTNSGPGGTGHRVRISGFEEWTIDDDGLIAGSQGHYDQAEYDRQLEFGTDEPR